MWSKSLSTAKAYEIEVRLRRFDGAFRWYLGRATPVTDQLGNVVQWFGTCTDIHAQKSLSLDRDKFLEAIRMVSSNPLIGAIRALELLANKKLGQLNEQQVVMVHRVIDSNKAMTLLLRKLKDGNLNVISSSEEVLEYAEGEATDIFLTAGEMTGNSQATESRKVETARHGERVAHSIMENAPIGIVTLDANLDVSDINSAFAAMIGRDREQLFDKSLSDILPSEAFRTGAFALKIGEQLQLFRQAVTVDHNGSEQMRYWDMFFWSIATEEGQLKGAVLQIIDCTDTVNLEQQRDDFVAAVVHDIKNPLIGAEGVFNILCGKTKAITPVLQAKMLSVLKESNQNLLNLVQNLVDVYRYQTMTYPVCYKAIDLKDLLASCFEQVAYYAESSEVTLCIHAPDSLPYLQADEIGIRRVFMNLLHNAIKFNRQGGTATVSIKQFEGAFQIDVADTGDGMNEADQTKLFQRFSQGPAGSRFSSGTGLGLYLSKQIVSAHHGSISGKSSVGCGAVFSVTLPLVPPPQYK
jgi:PAS domain S-box-containing protein